MRSRVGLSVVLAVCVTGCMHAAKVFLDIPERTTSARTGPAVDQVEGDEMRVAPVEERLEAAAIESVSDPDSVIELLPTLRSGAVDWMEAWEADLIRPRADDRPTLADPVDDFAYDLYLSTGDGPEAYFPHSSHKGWLACESCHPRVYRNGGASYSRESAHEEESCGACHGPVAFGIQACEQCHEAATGLPERRQEKSLGRTLRLSRAAPDTASRRLGQGYDLTGSYPPAVFPHGAHRLRYQCRACHESPFPMESGGTLMSEDDAHSIQGCGSCHDGLAAFGADVDSCNRCHVRDGG